MAVATRRRTKEYRLTQFHASDREVLAVIAEAVDEDGYADSADVARQFWPKAMSSENGEAKQAVAAVSRRLSWMSRFGVVIRERKSGLARWALTEAGDELLTGKLRASVAKNLDELDGAQAVIVASQMSERVREDDLYGTLMVRAWRFGTGRR